MSNPRNPQVNAGTLSLFVNLWIETEERGGKLSLRPSQGFR